MRRNLGIRWTIGNVSPRGFAALRLSLWGAFRLLGRRADYVVCVNSISVERARARTGPVPEDVSFEPVSRADLPARLARRLDKGMAGGAAWRVAPPRRFTERRELALDNDVILWELPAALERWLDEEDPERCLVLGAAEEAYGRFAPACEPGPPRSAGLRAMPPRFDLTAELRTVLEGIEGPVATSADQRGLEIAALSRLRPPLVVSLDDVPACGPTSPAASHLGHAGARFSDLNAGDPPLRRAGPATEAVCGDHFDALLSELHRRLAVPFAPRVDEGAAPALSG